MFLNNLRDLDPMLGYHQAVDAHEKTCAWVMKDSTFQEWKYSTPTRMLWINGLAGSGKSVLSRYIISELSKTAHSQLHTPVETQARGTVNSLAFVFCNDREKRGNDAASVLRSILLQLLANDTRLFQYLDESSLNKPSWQASVTNLGAAISEITVHTKSLNCWVIVDGLDEMHKNDGRALLHQLCRILDDDLRGQLKVLVTDRQGPEGQMPRNHPHLSLICLDVKEVHEDVKIYVSNLVDEFCHENNFPQNLIEVIQLEMISRSQGLFLLAFLNWMAFTQGAVYWDKKTVFTRLEELQTIPSTIRDLYCDLLHKVPEDFRPLLRATFMWMLVARQPLTVDDLHCAISIRPYHSSYQSLKADLGFNFT